jgi:CBS domain-containing protein/gamma-glutamylcysteine synthetase
MGEQRVSMLDDQANMHRFVRYLLNDVYALDYMLQNDWFESDVVRIGAEQEMCLVDNRTYKPKPIAMEALEKMKRYKWVETELAKFNLEINMDPLLFEGSCLSKMENATQDRLAKIRKKLEPMNADLMLTGILPTLRKNDLALENLTPKPRYFALIESINRQLIGDAFELRLNGIDELLVRHDSPLLEACNTSFQVHLQVSPDNFVQMHNIAQTLAAPVISIAANSPLVFGRRLWHESRIALFQQALDTRTTHEHMRERSPRVNFGSDWLHDSILEIYKEDIARFRVLLSGDVEEDSMALIAEGKVPKLRALQVHNSTVYRWNRPCYGISPNGKPHLRIENRVIPSGPTVPDEIANSAFWLGSMIGMNLRYPDITKVIDFPDIKDNFIKAARYGIDATLNWFSDSKIGACELIRKELLPIAREGLKHQNVDSADIDKYLGIIEERASKHMTGARWFLRGFTRLKKEAGTDEALTCVTACAIKNQFKNMPVHEWDLPELGDLDDYLPAKLKVEEFMTTDLFTVQKDDIIELVSELMDWRHIRYTPVESKKGKLIGLVTSRLLLRHFGNKSRLNGYQAKTVNDIMIKDPITVPPDTTIIQAMEIMRDNRISCLPVVTTKENDDRKELVGIITEMDFLRISARLMERLAKAKDH